MASAQTLINSGKKTVTLPKGVVVLTDSLKIYDRVGLVLKGSPSGTVLVYKGPPDKPAIDMRGTYRCILQDFQLVSDIPNVLAGIQISSIPSGLLHNGQKWGSPTSHCLFDRIIIGNANLQNPFKYSFLVGSNIVREHDGNNDWHEWNNCVISGFTESGVRITGGQCHALYFDRCGFSSYIGGKHAIHGEYGNFYTVNECGGGGMSDCDFLVSDFVHKVIIRGWNSENSRQLLRTGGPTGAGAPITLDGVRFAGNSGDPIIDYRMSGRLNLLNSTLRHQGLPKFNFAMSQSSFKMDNVTIECYMDIPANYSIIQGTTNGYADGVKLTYVNPVQWKRYKIPTNPNEPVILI